MERSQASWTRRCVARRSDLASTCQLMLFLAVPLYGNRVICAQK